MVRRVLSAWRWNSDEFQGASGSEGLGAPRFLSADSLFNDRWVVQAPWLSRAAPDPRPAALERHEAREAVAIGHAPHGQAEGAPSPSGTPAPLQVTSLPAPAAIAAAPAATATQPVLTPDLDSFKSWDSAQYTAQSGMSRAALQLDPLAHRLELELAPEFPGLIDGAAAGEGEAAFDPGAAGLGSAHAPLDPFVVG